MVVIIVMAEVVNMLYLRDKFGAHHLNTIYQRMTPAVNTNKWINRIMN